MGWNWKSALETSPSLKNGHEFSLEKCHCRPETWFLTKNVEHWNTNN